MNTMVREYKYPDCMDNVVCCLIDQLQRTPGYWDLSEKRVLEIAKKYIPRVDNSCFLDAGCGLGRNLLYFADNFFHLTGIDFDQNRLQWARGVINEHELNDKISLSYSSIENYEADKRFSTILCNHIIQHVNSYSVMPILEKLRELIITGGVLFLAVPHAYKPEDQGFWKSVKSNNRVINSMICEDDFNDLILNNQKVLPFQKFTLEQIEILLRQAGFRVLDSYAYHLVDDQFGDLRGLEADKLVNSTAELKKCAGWDMFIIAEPV